jgi:23S rRNA (cytosine1962-C5)-methyltransferase
MKTETRLLVADDWEDYALLDSGHLQKLERFGSQTVIRPDPQAFWNPAKPVQSWKADARFAATWACSRNTPYIGDLRRTGSALPTAR